MRVYEHQEDTVRVPKEFAIDFTLFTAIKSPDGAIIAGGNLANLFKIRVDYTAKPVPFSNENIDKLHY